MEVSIKGEFWVKWLLVFYTGNQSQMRNFFGFFMLLVSYFRQVFTPLARLINESLPSRSPFSNRDVLGLQMSLARSNSFLSFTISCISELASGVADGLFTHGLVCFGLNWLALSIEAAATCFDTENHALELLVTAASRVKSFSSVSSMADISWTSLKTRWSTS